MVLDLFHLDFLRPFYQDKGSHNDISKKKKNFSFPMKCGFTLLYIFASYKFLMELLSSGCHTGCLSIGILLRYLHRVQLSFCSKCRNKLMILRGVITLKTINQLMKFLISWSSSGTKPTFESHSWRNTDVTESFHNEL